MKKIMVILGCTAILLSACGKKDEDKKTQEAGTEITQSTPTAELENIGSEENAQEAVYFEDDFTKKVAGDTAKFKTEFKKFNEAQKYYFCAAFAMGAMSVAKPITASAMVNYFLGLGVNKYNVGINDENYLAFNAGKNTFLHESIVNVILKDKICEDIINEAADYAVETNKSVAELDKRGQIEVEKVVKYIQKQK
ncbi:MAG: hypothetical protein IKN71_03305 [Alphaproteobacteria bacterium]|nr:hypothetical protein [Alphaproteobacteria bacterium]